MFKPIATPCSRQFFPASRTSGTRKLEEIIWVVIHDEEAGSARSAAMYFADPREPEDGGPTGSAHLTVDDNECFRCLRNEDIPWAAPKANRKGFHIELAGFARWSTVIWRRHINTLRRGAYKAAVHCNQFGIPAVYLTAPDLRKGEKGITTHKQVSKAFGGTHYDPGPFFPMRLFIWLVRRYITELRDSVGNP